MVTSFFSPSAGELKFIGNALKDLLWPRERFQRHELTSEHRHHHHHHHHHYHCHRPLFHSVESIFPRCAMYPTLLISDLYPVTGVLYHLYSLFFCNNCFTQLFLKYFPPGAWVYSSHSAKFPRYSFELSRIFLPYFSGLSTRYDSRSFLTLSSDFFRFHLFSFIFFCLALSFCIATSISIPTSPPISTAGRTPPLHGGRRQGNVFSQKSRRRSVGAGAGVGLPRRRQLSFQARGNHVKGDAFRYSTTYSINPLDQPLWDLQSAQTKVSKDAFYTI